ncbi:MAG TPA: hypothetical protein DEP20_00195 [Fusobacteria bacterium]|nr:hypothetical protein [Fusobacteriota bacterium]|tara:strand:+ start:5580 stop:5882 length:303 start_codon:yes stop_codon:yes gene_type:complete
MNKKELDRVAGGISSTTHWLDGQTDTTTVINNYENETKFVDGMEGSGGKFHVSFGSSANSYKGDTVILTTSYTPDGVNHTGMLPGDVKEVSRVSQTKVVK